MSHELRTPLNGILGYVQILRREQTIKNKQGLDVIQRSGEHLLTLINEILDLSKIEAGKLETNPDKLHSDFKILIVDDIPDNRIILNKILIDLGFNILESNDGQEALEKAKNFKPNAIIMDGLESIRKLRLQTEFDNTIIIMMSANVYEKQQQTALEAGCNAFVEKPIDIEKFLALLGKLCSLEWIYETPEAPMEYPTAAEIEVLYNLAKMGKIKAIIDTSEALSINELKLASFSKKVTQLAREFKIQELKSFLEGLLNH